MYLIAETSSLPVRRPANSFPDVPPVASIHYLRATLRRATAELKRASVRSGQLLDDYASRSDHEPERMTLHIRARLDGLLRQADETLCALEDLAAATGNTTWTGAEDRLVAPKSFHQGIAMAPSGWFRPLKCKAAPVGTL